MCTIAIEALTPLYQTSRIKLYKDIARSSLFCRIAKRSINGFALEILKISSYETSGLGFGFSTQVYSTANSQSARVYDFDFIMKICLKIHKGFVRESHSGYNLTPSIIIHSQITGKLKTKTKWLTLRQKL